MWKAPLAQTKPSSWHCRRKGRSFTFHPFLNGLARPRKDLGWMSALPLQRAAWTTCRSCHPFLNGGCPSLHDVCERTQQGKYGGHHGGLGSKHWILKASRGRRGRAQCIGSGRDSAYALRARRQACRGRGEGAEKGCCRSGAAGSSFSAMAHHGGEPRAPTTCLRNT